MPLRRPRAAALVLLVATVLLALSIPRPASAGPVDGRVKHAMTIALDPATHRLQVADAIALPARPADGVVDFVLNAALTLRRSEPAATQVPLNADATFFGINGSGDSKGQVKVARYRVRLPAGQTALRVEYEGV